MKDTPTIGELLALAQLAEVGKEFNSRHLLTYLDGSTRRTLFKTIQRLEDNGKIRYTGKFLIYKRIA